MEIKNVELIEAGKKIIGREYLTDSDTLVIMLHGIGERGPNDLSKISLVEKLSGWPKYAKGQRPGAASVTGQNEYPFNIFAIQISEGSYHEYFKTLIPAMKKRYNPKKIVIAGISLGCIGLYGILSENTDEEIKVVIPICGKSDRNGSITKWKTVTGLAWHGDADTTIRIADHRTTVDEYNRVHKPRGGHIYFNTLKGVGHNAWDRAFNVDPAKDESLQFVLKELGGIGKPEPTPDPIPQQPDWTDYNAAIDEVLSLMKTGYDASVKLLQSKKR